MKRLRPQIKIIVGVALLVAAAAPITLRGQAPEKKTAATESSAQSVPMAQCYQAMASARKRMMARHQAMSAKLDEMMAEVRKASGPEKSAAMEALLGELVDQAKTMHMMAMHGPMMMGGMYGMGMGMGMGMGRYHGKMMQNCPMGPDCPMAKGMAPDAGQMETPTPPKQ
jgi:hypothetical protein